MGTTPNADSNDLFMIETYWKDIQKLSLTNVINDMISLLNGKGIVNCEIGYKSYIVLVINESFAYKGGAGKSFIIRTRSFKSAFWLVGPLC